MGLQTNDEEEEEEEEELPFLHSSVQFGTSLRRCVHVN